MRPTLQARALKESLLQYLSTTYALSDEGAREALHRFLGDETSGMFRGPYLRIRTPFTVGGEEWREHLEWQREGFTPYAHQAEAFARLTSANGHTPQPALITTGTGSGKTESFLYPVLDHCRREREAGKAGVKAVFLYPMNALATDQAGRINDLLTQYGELRKLWAGLYIGDRAGTQYEKVRTRRHDMQLSPPDILITNYKMLDLLLQREDDAPLWREANIQYVVVDEFHTYDGAQGSDVAMLLRRLASAVGMSEKGRPLGRICPVATSATLASGTDDDGVKRLLEVATDVFGTEFTAESIIKENRLPVEEFIPLTGVKMQRLPTPDELLALPDPTLSEEALLDLIEAVTGVRDGDPIRLGSNLKQHLFTRAAMQALDGELKTSVEVLDMMWRAGAAGWAEAVALQPEKAAEALARFVALLSYARDPKSPPDEQRPLVHVEVHQWARSVSRLLRGVLPWPKAEFRWDVAGMADASATDNERMAPVTTATSSQSANLFLPAVYCRDCGRSGWAVFSPESDDHDVQFNTFKIRRASLGQDKARVRNLIAATDREAGEGAWRGPISADARKVNASTSTQGGGVLMILDGARKRLRLPDPLNDYSADTKEPRLTARDSAFVLVHFGGTVANTAAQQDWCPACGARNAIRYLGTGSAAMAAASITQLFTGGELDKKLREDRTLMFNDSVQDAAHRAGFVANRSYTFSLRALLADHLSHDEPTALNELIANVVEATTDKDTLAAVVPPDLHVYKGVERLLSGQGRGGTIATWRLIGQRLAFETLMEFGFRSRNGRTLELTRTAAAHVRIDNPTAVAALVRRIHEESVQDKVPLIAQDDARYLAFVRIFLERLRTRGAVAHKWLSKYVDEAGTSRYYIWGGREPGMRAFPDRVAAPVFLLSPKKDSSEFDFATGRLSWHERWAGRCLNLPREMASEFWSRLLPELAALGLLAARTPRDTSLRVYGLKPGNIDAQLLDDDQVRQAYVRCPVCFWEQTVHPSLLDQWREQPCPSYRCGSGRLVAGDRPDALGKHHRDRDYTRDYYRRLYRVAGTYQVVTAEHTGMLTRPQRERVEQAFKQGGGFKDPNVLSCTPTLELGIDIGELSAVVLAALPRRPASYAQQIGRAGRRTGNAFLLTIPDRRRRDLYFLERPKDLIAGTIVPPGCYLSAIEILRRQYLAHLLDLAAAGRLVRPDGIVLRALPRRAPHLFGPSGYLVDLVEVALAHGAELAEGFLELFPTGVNDSAKADLRAYATHGLRAAVEEAEREWFRGEQALRARLHEIDEAHDELHDSDPDQARQKAELDAERRGVGRHLMNLGETPAQTALCDLGLLPNYALIDSTTTLSATLYGEEGTDPATGRPIYTSDTYTYERPRRIALQELAPGNTFYVNGYKHEISGLEIGTGGRQEWRTWRVCPACGYVRTENAKDDRSACPRCKGDNIADDGSCLFQVVEPATVTSRDKREDARIRDDKDDRDRRFYTVVDAVDMPVEDIEDGSWRHVHQTFGIDYCRRTMIRRINVGPVRYDAPARDDFAGHHVRLNPFHVCTACGAASADGRPVFNRHNDELDSLSARSGRLKHHRPWCPLRRGKKSDAREERVLLAHQLQTEALRVLLPAATADVDSKVHSFRAALRLGVDLHFGGDPQHLATTVASMPDLETGERRWFLVLFDSLPGGTGYLDRLRDSDAFRDTLTAAYEMLKNCPCAEEQRRACHRCLHRYTPEPFQDIVSRQSALTMLESLLFAKDGEPGWETSEVDHTGLVGLDAQVESDLEARFLAALRDWVKITGDASLDEDGHSSGHLRFTDSSGVTHWRLTAQQRVQGSVSDFTFTRVDGPVQSVKVYLEGFRFHASREHNRIATDAAKRTLLRADGNIVFQITWADIDLFEQLPTRTRPVWPPYAAGAQDQAKSAYEQYGGQRAHVAGSIFTNPIATLIAYLRNPDPTRWARLAAALVTGLTRQPGTTTVTAAGRRSELVAALRGQLAASPAGAHHNKPDETGIGPVHVFRAQDDTGLPIVFAVDAADPEALKWTALTILDDNDTVLDTDEHKERWRAWLYWTNLTQFLSLAGGDGVQLASSQAAHFEVEVLAICGGLGELDSLTGAPAVATEPTGRDLGSAAEAAAAQAIRDAVWDEDILEILREEPNEAPDLIRLAETLADRGKQAPVFGYELGVGRWLAEFAWHISHGVKVAVVSAHQGDDDDEAQRRDAAYIEEGWIVRTAAEWLAHLDELLEKLPDVKEGAAR
ncbi:DEAD/DEAH box helicase [Nonomuraea sp. NPDC049758]|uniref:DEAD/DEAH box helicase n=1 Tax=Nonomuraea sp. NPDC049758 TaxID=3154360 RepID=UPI00342A521A